MVEGSRLAQMILDHDQSEQATHDESYFHSLFFSMLYLVVVEGVASLFWLPFNHHNFLAAPTHASCVAPVISASREFELCVVLGLASFGLRCSRVSSSVVPSNQWSDNQICFAVVVIKLYDRYFQTSTKRVAPIEL